MHGLPSIFATSPIKFSQTDTRKVISIKAVSDKLMPANRDKVKLTPHVRSALTVDELTLEETFYVFDYGNAM
jgi:hypothetical protein